MENLYGRLATLVGQWRDRRYPHEDYPAIQEILEYALNDEGQLRFLRKPQLRALETYWYLRLVQGTPKIFDLYRKLYLDEGRKKDLLEVLGVPDPAFQETDYDLDAMWQRVKTDDDFVRRHQLHALRETLALDYPSYILALAMGAGKTFLIGAIVGSEFAMAQEYPHGPFVQNALVFAPGKTIIESLRQLNRIPFKDILPPRMFKVFSASLKLTFTRDGEKDIPVIRGSIYNVVVTNTEKIRIHKEQVRKADLQGAFNARTFEEARTQVANQRLQAIASLPHLAIFSDEAHHTYGQSLEAELKKVRLTVDYLAHQTSVVCVVNTTGTPYFRRQPLKDVVVWYGLSQGIADGILKDLAGNIQSFDFDGNASTYVSHVVRDFFDAYGDVTLPDGAPAKLAIYFPQTDDLDELRPAVDQALVDSGVDPSVVLVNTNKSGADSVEAFNRLNDPASPQRVILLVNKGTEGWDCPSLFACALARKLKTSNNFVLQAASRCLRQVPGNMRSARVYLSQDNYSILDKQLAETYGETINNLRGARSERRHARLVLRKLDIPPVMLKKRVHTIERQAVDGQPLHLNRPEDTESTMHKHVYTLAESYSARKALSQVEATVEIATTGAGADAYATAADLSAQYRLPLWGVYDELRRLYGSDDIPAVHLTSLAWEIEQQTRNYIERDEEIEVALALVRPEGFDIEMGEDDKAVYTIEITYAKDKEHLLMPLAKAADSDAASVSFHYDPYNFDSIPEEVFLEDVLAMVNELPHNVREVYFTGAITDPAKTDFSIEYKDQDGRWRRYTPDFVIRRKDGKVLIVEIKGENQRDDHINGEMGLKAAEMRRWEKLNPDTLRYEILFARDRVATDDMQPVRDFWMAKS
jgi:type III restriction enzyme